MDSSWGIKYVQGEPQHQGCHESNVTVISEISSVSRIVCFKPGKVMVPFVMKMYEKLNSCRDISSSIF